MALFRGLTTIRLLTNNPRKLGGIQDYGFTASEQGRIEVVSHAENCQDLKVVTLELPDIAVVEDAGITVDLRS